MGWGGYSHGLVVVAVRTRHVVFVGTAIVVCVALGSLRENFAFAVAARQQIKARLTTKTYSEAYRDGVLDMERAAFHSSRYTFVAIAGLAVLAIGFYGGR
jgi:hypothetical protein